MCVKQESASALQLRASFMHALLELRAVILLCVKEYFCAWVCYCGCYTHTLFNCPLSGMTRVSRYQKGKTILDFTEARDSEWQWHQLGHMQDCTSLHTDNHASTPLLSFYRPYAVPAAQPTASKHWRHRRIYVCNQHVICIFSSTAAVILVEIIWLALFRFDCGEYLTVWLATSWRWWQLRLS